MHSEARWVLSHQLAVTVVAALLAGLMQGFHAAMSALLGGSISVISGYVYVWRALRKSSTLPRQAFGAQVAGEGYKFAITLLLFAAVFKSYSQVEALPLFLAYASTIVVYWLALLKQR